MRIPGGEPTPPTGKEVESPQEKAKRIFGEIMGNVETDLGSWANGLLVLKHDAKYGIMTLIDGTLQRITFFYGAYRICSEKPKQATKIVENLGVPKSQIAACVAFLCHACSHQEVGAAVKRDLSERQERQDLKFIIKSIIGFFGGGKFNDPNVETITIDDSYKVVIQLSPNSAKESSNLTIEYSLDW